MPALQDSGWKLYRFSLRERLFVGFENVLHASDVLLVQFPHGRGRDAGHPAPPAQIPTCGQSSKMFRDNVEMMQGWSL